MGERGVELRVFMCCLKGGEGRKKEDLKINLRLVNFSLTEVRRMRRGTDFRGREVQRGSSECEGLVGHSGGEVY